LFISILKCDHLNISFGIKRNGIKLLTYPVGYIPKPAQDEKS